MPKKAKNSPGKILVLADDLTGALEAGAKFAGQGITSRVSIANRARIPVVPRAISVMVLDTETRHAPSEEAEHKVHELCRAAIAGGFGLIYKKTDSTLRGNISSELRGLLQAWQGCSLLYVPAYPKMGRTVDRGILYVDGKSVSATDFASDQLNPIAESSIVKLLAPHSPLPVISIDKEKACQIGDEAVYVCDAETEDELEQWAQFFLGSRAFRLAAGPAAFLHYLAKHAQLPRTQPAKVPRIHRALIVCGSRNRRSLDQIQYAKEQGFPVIYSADKLEQTGEKCWWILDNKAQGPESSDQAADRVAKSVLSIVKRTDLDAVVVFGGDTAYAVLRALGKPEVHPIGEALEGVPVSRIGLGHTSRGSGEFVRDLVVVTKAGGFGPRNVLPMLRDALV